MAKKTKADETALTSKLQNLLRGAVGVSQTNIANKQALGLRLYRREPLDGDYKNGKLVRPGSSQYVSGDVQERTDWFVSGFLHIFDSQQQVVSFQPNGPEDQPLADQLNQTVNFVVREKNSHVAMLEPWIKNGAITGLGVVMAEFKSRKEEMLPELIKGVTDEALVQFDADEEAGKLKIIEVGEPYEAPKPELPQGIPQEMAGALDMLPPIMVRDIKIRRIRKNIQLNIKNLAPEDFIVSEDADFDQQTGGIAARVQGHKRLISKAELIEMGFDRKKVEEIEVASDDDSAMAIERAKDVDQGVGDDDVWVYEIYTQIALEDDVRRHYRFTLAGDLENNMVLLHHEEVSKFYPYAAFVPFPVPNTLFGMGIADRVGKDQVTKSKFIRAIHDNLNWHVNPLRIADPSKTHLDDLLTAYPGKTIRSSDPTGGISYNQPAFSGMAAMPIIDALDRSMDYTTGVGGSMASVNPSDLQNTTATANAQRASSQQLLTETAARNFADRGYRYLFRIIVDLLVNNPEDAQAYISRLTNKFQPLRIDEWDPDMDMTANVAFGVSDKIGASANLNTIMALQDKLAPMGLSDQNTAYNSAVKMAEIAGYKNPAMFFVDPTVAAQKAQQAAQQPPPVNPMVEAEQVKAQAAAAEKEKDRQVQIAIETMKNDRERDRAQMEFELKRAEIQAKYAAQVDIARLQAQIDAKRSDFEMAMAERDAATKAAQERAQQEAQAAQQAQAQQAAAMQAQQAAQAQQMPPQA